MRLSTASVSGTATTASTGIKVRLADSSVTATATTSSSAIAVYQGNGSVTETTTTQAIGYIYGEEWVNVTPESSSWVDKTISADGWVDKSVNVLVWNDIINDDPAEVYVLTGYWDYGYNNRDLLPSSIWTDKTIGNNQWLQQ
jgi:hypothetical protein